MNSDATRIEPPPAKEETRHTPTPWKAGEAAWYRGRAKDDTESGKRPITAVAVGHPVIANVYGSANAAHIVHCVNLHDELVAALEGLLEAALVDARVEPGRVEIARSALLRARVPARNHD